MPTFRVVVWFAVFLIGVLQANLKAAPVPFQPYGQTNSTEVILQLAVLNDSPWAVGLENIQGLESSGANEAVLSALEALVNQHMDDEQAQALLIPLYWFKSEITGNTFHRQLFLNNLSNESDVFLRLANVDILLQWHELSQAQSANQEYARSAQEIRLQYEQLQSLFDRPEQSYTTQLWAKALLYFYMPGGGLKVADAWLQSLVSINKPEIIIVYRKLLHDLAGQSFPPLNPSCWPLTCANAMTTNEMARRAQRAYKFFSNDGFGQAWQYLKAGVHCLYNAQSNPVMFSYSLCLSYFNNLNGILTLLADSTAVMSSAGWQEYWLIKNTYAETLNFQNRVSSQVQYAYRNEEERINRIEDPETRLQESQNLLDSPLSGFASSYSVQQARQGNERQLQAIRGAKKKRAAIDRFQTNFQKLKQQVDCNPSDESLWEKLQSLVDSEDAKTALESSARKKLKEQADSSLALAKENNRINRSFQKLKANEATILQNFDHDPEGALEALIALYSSDLADSLTNESRNAISEKYKAQLNTLRAKQRERVQEQARIQSSYDRAKSKLDQLTSEIQQSPNDESLIAEYIALLDSHDARTGFTENSRLNLKAKAVALLERAKETNALWEDLEKDRLFQASCDVDGCPDEFELNYDGQLLASLGLDYALLKSLLSASPLGRTVTALTTAGMAAWQLTRQKGQSDSLKQALLEDTCTHTYYYKGKTEGRFAVTDADGESLPVVSAKGALGGLNNYFEIHSGEHRITFLPGQPNSARVYKGNSSVPVPAIIYARELHKPGVQQTATPAHIQDWKAFVLVHPASETPLLVMLSVDPRYQPGVVSGQGQDISALSGRWLEHASEGQGAPVPRQVAEKLRGREFANFDKFREAFWQEVASLPQLNSQFTKSNINRMLTGKAPRAVFTETVGKRRSFEIHHLIELSTGGAVYDIDNLRILTPKVHIRIHSKGN